MTSVTTDNPSALKPVPGDAGIPIFGATFKLIDNPIKYYKNLYQAHGEISWTRFLGIKVYMMLGPEASQFIYLDKESSFSSGKGWDFFIRWNYF